MRPLIRLTPCLALVALFSCEDSPGAAEGSSGVNPGQTSAAETGATSSATGTTTGADEGTTTTSPGPNTTMPDPGDDDDDPIPPISFDLAATPDFGEFDTGCSAVDFLFVIDNSGSMFNAQTNLVDNFPAFINGIQNTLTDVESYHVGVTTTDAYLDNVAGCQALGSLVVQTGGFNSSDTACGPYTEGNNFITEEDDLSTAFSCAAEVGTAGDPLEIPMTAMQRAIDGSLAGEGQCNEGFLRDNALLVVVIITDEYDGSGDPEGDPPVSASEGTPESWHQAVVDAKDGIPENAAALVLTNYANGPCAPASNTSDGRNMVDFAGLFGENGFVGGICEPDYGPIFTSATAVIEQACENFVPPG